MQSGKIEIFDKEDKADRPVQSKLEQKSAKGESHAIRFGNIARRRKCNT